jgi:hypothetical protein
LAEFILFDPRGCAKLADSLNLSSREAESLKRALRRATQDFVEEKHALEKAKALLKKIQAPKTKEALSNEPPSNLTE